MKTTILIRAILFSLLINLPALYEFLASGGWSPRILSDWDEAHYLPLAYSHAGQLLTQISTGDFNLRWLISPIPYHITEVLFVAIARLANLSLSGLGLILDLVLVPISYLIFTRAFSYLTKSATAAEIASFMLLFFPWAFYLRLYISIPSPFGPEVIAFPHELYPCQPILRSISTQISYPIFALSLLMTFKGLTGNYNRENFLRAGLYAGFTNYLYFFAWPALCAFIGFLVLISGIYERQITKAVKALAAFLIGTLATSSVALWSLTKTYASTAISSAAVEGPIKSDFFYFSPEQFVLLILITLIVFYRRPRNYLAKVAIAACILSEFALMNSQAFIKAAILPYHFPLFYLHPLMTGCVILLVFEILQSPKIARTGVAICITMAVLVTIKFVVGNVTNRVKSDEFAGMFQYIHTNVNQNLSILALPWDNAFKKNGESYLTYLFPYWINTMTHNALFADPVRNSWESTYQPELIAGLIFSGEAQLVAPCPKSLPQLPGDSLRGVMTSEYIARYNFCRAVEAKTKSINLCQLVKDGTPDYVAWQYDVIKEVPQNVLPVLESVWKGKLGTLELFRFNKERAEAIFCRSV